MPELAAVEALALATPRRTVTLSGISVTVLFSALDAANRLYDWWGVDGTLNPVEIDRVDEILALARKELMVESIGRVEMFATNGAPAGYLICDGSSYAAAEFPILFSVIADNFKTGLDSFVVPDLRESFVYGAASSVDVGAVGGAAAVALSEFEMPIHAHSIQTTITTLALEPGEVTVLTPVPLIPSYTGNTGGGAAHNNIPPYVKLAFYIQAV